MTFISYAQNFEDVLLHRALRDITDGFYIDVGAWYPDTDSVTRAFHDRGWRGINVEPGADAFQRLQAARPRDVNLRVLAGEQDGEAVFFTVEGTGLSTTDAALAERHRADGHRVHQETMRITTLAALCRQHAPGVIHFLKVDVEGAERAVLAGADFSVWRPWIVLVEATAPGSAEETHAAWEGILQQAGYRFVWFDGLNRFYLAEEQATRLAPYFRTPPNVFDDFVRCNDSEYTRRIAETEARAAEQRVRMEIAEAASREVMLRAANDQAQARAAAERAAMFQQMATEHAAALAELNVARGRDMAQHAQGRQRLQEAAARLQQAESREQLAMSWLGAVARSTSWRVTAPLRRLRGGGDDLAAATLPRPTALPPLLLDIAPEFVAGADAAPPRQPATREFVLHSVHQFHSGSALGDAITNAMLLTRDVLRGLGYHSEIFVEHRDKALAGELRLLDELPGHDRYVLIVRHSMGYDSWTRIAGLPAPKVLLYHNITPPELLAHPTLQHYARLGRAQLAQWRGKVVAALADSEYNAAELRRLGFDAVQACMLLFDADALLARAAAHAAPRRGSRFTLLFVGRINASKAQDALVDAFAAFCRRFDAPARLVLVGRHDGENDPFLRRIRERARAGGVADRVVLTGLVSDADLHNWYNEADLYVSLSQHEGFGVPLLEAVAHGVPVLANPAGAVPYTLGTPSALLEDAAPEAVAGRILALARDAASRHDLVRHQRQSLHHFRLDAQRPALLHALALAGAAPPPSAEARRKLAENLRFAVTGHVNGSYSLATINRTLALQLEEEFAGRVRLLPVDGVPTSDLAKVPEAERPALSRLVARPRPISGPELVISQHYPVLVPEQRGDCNAALFFWEESVVPAETIAVLNNDFDLVLAPSGFVAKVLVDSGLSIPVRNVGFAPYLDPWHALAGDRRPDAARPFTFLHVSSCFPRKGVDVLLAAWARAFVADDKVRLIIKGFPNPHNDVAEQIARLRAHHANLAPITFIDRDVDDDALLDLYREADALVLPTRGEGFNMPAAEAMAAGIPLIVTGHGGHMDFCKPGEVRLLDYGFAPSRSHLASAGSVWIEPDMADLAEALREALTTRPSCLAVPEARDVLARINRAAVDVLLAPPPRELRIGFLSSWGVRCGVAEYARLLLEAAPRDHRIGRISVFCDRRTGALAEDARFDVRRCWSLGLAGGVAELEAAIGNADPEILVVQHQPGLFGWGELAALLDSKLLGGRIVVVTLHNTRHLHEEAAAKRRAVLMALGRVARVVVHTIDDLNGLKAAGLVDNVTLLPQGTPPLRDAPLPRELRPGTAPLLGCYGFFLPGKGIPQLIAALARLRQTWPGIRLRLVNAEYEAPQSAAEIAACREAAAAAGLADAVEFVTGFLPNEESLALLAECDAIVLPYQNSKEASSAALRMALSAGPPVAVTPLALFNEAEPAVHRLPGTRPEDLAAGLTALLQDAALRQAVQERARPWMQQRAWNVVAARLQGMLLGLHRSKD